MALLDIFNDPTFALGAGLLAPTPNASFGGGLLQGLEAGTAMRAANNRSELAQNEAQLQQRQLEEELAARQRREAQAKALEGLLANTQDPRQRAILEASIYTEEPAQRTISALQSSLFDAPAGSGFGGTGIKAQAANMFTALSLEAQNRQLTQEESLQLAMAKRFLTERQRAGSEETGFYYTEPEPLPNVPGQSQRQTANIAAGAETVANQVNPSGQYQGQYEVYLNPSSILPADELTKYIDPETGMHPAYGTTRGEILNPNSNYFVTTSEEQIRLAEGKSAQGIIGMLRDMSGVGTDRTLFKDFKTPLERLTLGGKNAFEYYGGQNVELSTYTDVRKATLSLLTRAFGEKGTLTYQDIARINLALPNVVGLTPDTEEVAEEKFRRLESIVTEIDDRFNKEAAARAGLAPEPNVPVSQESIDIMNIYLKPNQ